MNLAAIILVLAATALAATALPHLVLAIGSWRDRQRLAAAEFEKLDDAIAAGIAEFDTELAADFAKSPQAVPYTGWCSCGWKLLHGPATGHVTASSSDEAVRKIVDWHDRCLSVQAPLLIHGSDHHLHVSSFYPAN